MLDSTQIYDGDDQPGAHDADRKTNSPRRASWKATLRDETLSGNSVNLEQEMIKLGDVNRAYSMGTNIKRAIHQMMMSALK